MSKLIITTGPPTSGKSLFASHVGGYAGWRWTQNRRMAKKLLDEGFDVVLDEERPNENRIDLSGFGTQHSIELKTFTAGVIVREAKK